MPCYWFVCLEEQCRPSPCGQNTKCEVIGGTPTCSCLPGYTGSPLSGCRHECESDGECGGQEFCQNFKCASSCSQCGQGAQCARVNNHRAVCECPKVKYPKQFPFDLNSNAFLFTSDRVTSEARTPNVVLNAMVIVIVHLAVRPVSTAFVRARASEPAVLVPIVIYVDWRPSAVVHVTWPAIHLLAAVHLPKKICAARIHVAPMHNASLAMTTPARNGPSAPVYPATPVIRWATVSAASVKAMPNARIIGHASITLAWIHALDNVARTQFVRHVAIWLCANAHPDLLAMHWYRVANREVFQWPDTTRSRR